MANGDETEMTEIKFPPAFCLHESLCRGRDGALFYEDVIYPAEDHGEPSLVLVHRADECAVSRDRISALWVELLAARAEVERLGKENAELREGKKADGGFIPEWGFAPHRFTREES